MTARTIASRDADNNETHLVRGTSYRACTTSGEATGEYLGMEAPHGDLAIMLRDTDSVHSIELDRVTSIERLAA